MAEAYRILWVAPDKQIQLHLLKSIETAEFDITTATDCMSAMGQVKKGGIDLVLLMAGIEGFAMSDICRVLKSLTPDKFLPTVLLSTAPEGEGKPSSADEAGADDYMTLPLQPGEFRARVRALMHTKVLQDQLADSKNQLEMSLQREHSLMVELREDNRQLKERSITDGLTCLYNHRYFTEWLKMEFKISRRYGHRLSMIMVDVDHFKQVNDGCGHMFGDYVLKEVAVILKNETRESDFVARYAGDEFVITLPRTAGHEAQLLATRVLRACRKHPFKQRDGRIGVTMSLGCATYPDDPEIVSPEVLVYLADQALYHAKRRGRDNVCAWSEMEDKARRAIRGHLRNMHHQNLLGQNLLRPQDKEMVVGQSEEKTLPGGSD